MFCLCGSSILLKRSRSRIAGRQLPFSSRREAYTNSLGFPSAVSVDPLSSSCGNVNELAPELVYGDKDSFHMVRPQLRELFRYREVLESAQYGNICKHIDFEDTITVSPVNCSNAPNDSKLQLEEEERFTETPNPSHLLVENEQRTILERILFAVYFKGKDEDAEWLFEQVLRDHKICVICLEDFESGCSIRILHCAHFFHSHCLRQWLSKSRQCPLCKDYVDGKHL